MRATSDASIPCHRVIAAGGKLGGFGRDLFAKRALLLAEGVIVSNGRVRNFRELRWKGRRGNFP
jgi:methylated-DNA-[protein]-cysteine S-methyltransferase